MDKERAIITNKLVKTLTGRPMEDWFVQLDAMGAQTMNHEAIFQLAGSIEGLLALGEWNQNLFTTTYEWNRGLKERGQKKDGFEISVSKTFPVPVSILYQFWTDETLRTKWLSAKSLDITKATQDKSLRIAWPEGNTRVSVELYAKGAYKSQMMIQHMKIVDAAQAAAHKQYWSEQLQALTALQA